MARNMKLEGPRLSESNTLMELYWLDEFSFILRDNIFFLRETYSKLNPSKKSL